MLVNSSVKSLDVVDMLQTHLADLHMVYSHLHNFHWNVEGAHFFEYHEHLQEMYEDVAEKIDDVAERILQIGERPIANLVEYAQKSSLQSLPSDAVGVPQVASYVLSDLNHLISKLREGIKFCNESNDEGTMDFLVEMLRDYEKTRWFWSAISA